MLSRETDRCLVWSDQAWSGDRRDGPFLPDGAVVMRYNRSCLDSFKKESTRGFQPSSEEKLIFPHGDLRIAVPDPPSLQERVS